MLDLSSEVQWWEEWQQRILVLGSLFLQFVLFVGSMIRDIRLPSLFKSCIWLAYIGGDALPIYALSTLFNRQKLLASTGQLEVLWAPVLLLHLGGLHTLSAYSIEDNELWPRHIVSLVSQVTVAFYVFSKSWSGGDKRLLQAAILLFIVGTLNAIKKLLALRASSFRSLVTSSSVYPQRRVATQCDEMYYDCCLSFQTTSVEDAELLLREEEEHDLSLEEYVQKARDLALQTEVSPSAESRGESNAGQPMDPSLSSSPVSMGMEERVRGLEVEKREISSPNAFSLDSPPSPRSVLNAPYFDYGKLFVDLSKPYYRRLRELASFMCFNLRSLEQVLMSKLSDSFMMIYTNMEIGMSCPGCLMKLLLPSMCLASAVLFNQSRKDGFKDNDVKVTYIMLWCTTLLAFLPLLLCGLTGVMGTGISFITAAQHNLISFSARRIRPTKLMKFFAIMGCMDYINKHWYIEQESHDGCIEVIALVFEHLKDGWKQYIVDGASYKRFNNLRGQWAMSRHNICHPRLLWSLQVPFDQSVIVWHVATELCLHHPKTSSTAAAVDEESARGCSKVISNYMIYLLLIRPEMLMPGSRQGLFTLTSDDIELILKQTNEPPSLDRRSVAERILHVEQSPLFAQPLPQYARPMGTWILKACKLAEDLMELLGDQERWLVIQGVWVEILCYSAGRCRGYLHAKSMGEGVEFLSCIWFLLYEMGMETFADKFQRPEPAGGEEIDPGNSASQPQDRPVEEIEDIEIIVE
ncbi:hypothetical protein ACP70R_049645 [Stipagrostis hirtigluma subsp. patula]